MKSDHFVATSGRPAADSWSFLRGGFRLDGEPSGRDQVSVQGEVFDGELEQSHSFSTSLDSLRTQVFPSDTPISGGHPLGRWQRTLGNDGETALQVYYDRSRREEVVLDEQVDVLDLDFQHRLVALRLQDVTWGLGYRQTCDRTRGGTTVWFVPARRTYGLFSSFVQDEPGLARDRVRLTLGAKFEHNAYTGFEVQPGARLRSLEASPAFVEEEPSPGRLWRKPDGRCRLSQADTSRPCPSGAGTFLDMGYFC